MLRGRILLTVAFVLLVQYGTASARDVALSSTEGLTLDQAITIALHNNHAIKIAQLAVERADEDISAAKTFRLPSLRAFTLVSGKLVTSLNGGSVALKEVLDMAALGRIKILVDRYPLSAAKQAYDDFELGRLVGRAVLIPAGSEARAR